LPRYNLKVRIFFQKEGLLTIDTVEVYLKRIILGEKMLLKEKFIEVSKSFSSRNRR